MPRRRSSAQPVGRLTELHAVLVRNARERRMDNAPVPPFCTLSLSPER
jgi:hypothetical protein